MLGRQVPGFLGLAEAFPWGCGAVAVRFFLCNAFDSLCPGLSFVLQFIASEIIARVVTGGFMKRIVSHSVRVIRKAAGLASGAINSFLRYGRSLTSAVLSAVTGGLRAELRNA